MQPFLIVFYHDNKSDSKHFSWCLNDWDTEYFQIFQICKFRAVLIAYANGLLQAIILEYEDKFLSHRTFLASSSM